MAHEPHLSLLTVGVIVFVFGASPADAQNKCAGAKIKAACQRTSCKAELEAKEAQTGEAIHPDKAAKCEEKFDSTFAKFESKGGCLTTTDGAAIAAKVDAFVADLATELDVASGTNPNACEGAKIKAAAKKAACKCNLFAKEAKSSVVADPVKLTQCEAKFEQKFATLEAKGGCNTADDAVLIEAKVDAFVADVETELRPPVFSTCAPVTVTTLHGDDPFYGNTRLARIENGTVPCVHAEKGTRAKCTFTATSGSWVESASGTFARAGQAISRQGEPGGEYVVATRVSAAGTIPCIEPSGMDTAGTPSGSELVQVCVVEVAGSARNATRQPLLNHATLEVCTSSRPHPDQHGASPTFNGCFGGEFEPVYCCYTGEGAALNDINGTERDPSGMYHTGSGVYCHVIWTSDGFEVSGAKRPATGFFPPPVKRNTPIVWRPVSTVDVANP